MRTANCRVTTDMVAPMPSRCEAYVKESSRGVISTAASPSISVCNNSCAGTGRRGVYLKMLA